MIGHRSREHGYSILVVRSDDQPRSFVGTSRLPSQFDPVVLDAQSTLRADVCSQWEWDDPR